MTSVFSDAFAVTDTGAHASFNSIYLYAFGQPPDVHRRRRASSPRSRGNVSKFVGFTELNFPLFNAADDTAPLATLPAPVLADRTPTSPTPPSCSAADAGVVQLHRHHLRSAPPNPTNDATIQKTDRQW